MADPRARPPLTRRMAGLLDNIRRAGRPPFHTMIAREVRRVDALTAESLDLARARLARVAALQLSSADGTTLPARLYATGHGLLPMLLDLHGGAFTVGGLDTHDSRCRQFALRSGAAGLALDDRLAVGGDSAGATRSTTRIPGRP